MMTRDTMLRYVKADTLGAERTLPMISHQRMARYVHAEPFRPFRITLNGGRTFDIRHPEMIQLGRTTMTIFTLLSNETGAETERQVEVSLLLMESVETLDTANRPQGA